jgi:hypothetical protein
MLVVVLIIYFTGVVLTYGLAYGTQRATWPSSPKRRHRIAATFLALLSFFGMFGVAMANLTTSDIKWGWRIF